jgi:hypothetical protein
MLPLIFQSSSTIEATRNRLNKSSNAILNERIGA